MPKFQSQLVREEKLNKEGKILQSGEIVLIPLDDAAMLEPCCEKALSMGLIKDEEGKPYTQEAFEKKREQIRASFKKKMNEDMKRRQPYS
jgi:hypothetical protein